MSLDWTSVLIQLANFALLVVLLRIFLYRPVLRVMDERAEATAAPLREARRLAEEAAQEREALREERASLDRELTERLAAADRELASLRRTRLEEIERETKAARAAAMSSVERGIARSAERLKASLANLVVEEVRHNLAELAGASLDEQVWANFAERLRALKPQERERLAEAARTAGVVVITPHPLSRGVADKAREELGGLLGDTAGVPPERVSFAVDPELLLGVALEAGGLRLDGTAAARLEALEASFAEVLEAERT